MGFGAVGVIIVAMIGVGVAEESGLIATLVRKIVEIAPRSIFTFIIVMLGVVSSIAADAGYLVLVPLGAAAFHSLGRHPLAGLAAAFSGVAGGLPRQPLRDADRRAARRDDQRRDPPGRPDARGDAGRQPLLHDRLVDPDGDHLHHPDREGRRAAPRPLQRRGAGRGAAQADPDRVARPAPRRLGAARLRGRRRPLDRAAGGAAAPPRDRRDHLGLAVHVGPDRADQRAVLHRRLRLRQGDRDGDEPDRGDQHGGQDLLRHGRADLPAAGHRPVHRLLQLHQHRDGAGGEPRRLPRDRAARRRRATSSSSCW